MNRLLAVSFLFLLLSGTVISQTEEPPELLWRRALGGGVSGYPAQGPNGDVYVVAADRALHSVDPATGRLNWIYRPGGRLRNFLAVAPDGTIYIQNDRLELYAVTPGGTGRWRLNLDAAASVLPAVAADGRLILALTGGDLVCLSRRGRILWTQTMPADAAAAPVVDGMGTVWVPVTDGRILSFDSGGSEGRIFSVGWVISVLAMDETGRFWAGGINGQVAVFDPGADEAEPVPALNAGNSRVLAILSLNGGMAVFLADGTVVFRGERSGIGALGGTPSVSAAGTLYVPAADGSLRVLGDFENREGGMNPSRLIISGTLGEPLLTRDGILIAGGSDWTLRAWKGERPGSGWSQLRGGAARDGVLYSVRLEPNREDLRRSADFFFRERMARSNDIDQRIELLQELEAFPGESAMLEALPWAGLLLEDLAASGTLRQTVSRGQGLSHPTVRARAYGLLAVSEDFRSRRFLLACLKQEDDPMALAAGFLALAEVGSDWDGESMRLIAGKMAGMSTPSESLILTALKAVERLVHYNGGFTDSSGAAFTSGILERPLSASGRRQAMDVVSRMAGLR